MDDDALGRGTAALDRLLDRLVDALAVPGTAGTSGTGTDADAFTTAVVSGAGRLDRLDLDPRVLRDTASIPERIRTAVNAALDARPDQPAAGAQRDELRAIAEQSVEVTQQLNAALVAGVERLSGAMSR